MKKKRGSEPRRTLQCDNPPCIHVVYDERRRIYAIFIEFDEENIFPIEAEMLEAACRDLAKARGMGLREANPQETDFLAVKYLNARPVE
ncbi:MAG: hypothetical protein F7C38_03615 [Desulfurococcales archaeon]|nr:hypothetical protein [Desulfurococcales archaeon]